MFIRSDYQKIYNRILEDRKYIQVIAGPRQVGKTTLVKQIFDNIPEKCEFVSADSIAAINGDWIDEIWESLRIKMSMQNIETAIIAFDEIQKISNWSEFVKKNWDFDSLNNIKIKIILLGSSRLLIQNGLTESLAGRFELLILDHWSYQEMSDCFGISHDEYAWFGGYPGAIDFRNDEDRFKSYVSNAIIEPTISKDILMLDNVKKPALLRQLFEVGTQYNSELLSYTKILGRLQDAGNSTTLTHYSKLLEGAGLLSTLDKFSPKIVLQKASIPKFQLQNMALMSAQNVKSFEYAKKDLNMWGRVVEGAIGAKLLAAAKQDSNLKLFYWRENISNISQEVDFVLQYGDEILGIEVKSGQTKNASGLTAFKRRFPTAKTLLISNSTINWQDFLSIDIRSLFEDFGS